MSSTRDRQNGVYLVGLIHPLYAHRAEVVGVAIVLTDLALLQHDCARAWKVAIAAVVAEISHNGLFWVEFGSVYGGTEMLDLRFG
jgi:hypothetical protein